MKIEFLAWPKIPRLYRDATVTEKIDGTNAAIGILVADQALTGDISKSLAVEGADDNLYLIYAQSRSRIITPEADNFGFASWVFANARTLIADLGVGLHNGEWWGKGIQRGYGVPDKRFSLFNTAKWGDAKFETPNLMAVPVLLQHTFDTGMVDQALIDLAEDGSQAAPGFKPAEGICIYHHASRQIFKATIENDATPKSRLAA